MQGRTGVFTEWMQGRHLYILRYLASIFSNSVSTLIMTLSLSGHNNRYWPIVAVAHNNDKEGIEEVEDKGLSLPPHRYIQNVQASS